MRGTFAQSLAKPAFAHKRGARLQRKMPWCARILAALKRSTPMTAFGDVLRTAPGVLCWTRTHVHAQPPWQAHVHPQDLAQVTHTRNGNTAYRICYR